MPKRVLILDTELNVSIGAYLNEQGFEVNQSSDLLEFERSRKTQPYDAVIVDVEWPGEQGLELIARIRELSPGTAIIAVSEFTDRELEQEARKAGALYCLPKSELQEDILQILKSATSPDYQETSRDILPGKQIEQFLLRGFTPDQQWDFRMMGSIRAYDPGAQISLDDEDCSMIWVEAGNLGVYYNSTQVDKLGQGDFWGEECFVNPGAMNTRLVAEDSAQLRHFSRKRLIEFFAYNDETLTKRYIINLVICLHRRCKRALTRLASIGAKSIEEN